MSAVETFLARLLGPARAADMRTGVSSLWRWGFAAAGKYKPIPADEIAIEFEQKVCFKGDVPVQIFKPVREQGRMVFRIRRPATEEALNLVVTPEGGVWRDGRFEERYSAGKPGLRLLVEPRKPREALPEAVIIQSAHNDTYGDWISEYVVNLLRAAPFGALLLLPKKIASKPYVVRDLAALGVDWRPIEHPIEIGKARVLRQQKFFVHFSKEEAELLRSFFGAPEGAARPGGIVYLSRHGESSDVADRHYPHHIIETMVKARGGRVIRTSSASAVDYAVAAADAETVIFDHGSAFYNALAWPVRRVVEIVSDSWWNNAFLMLAEAIDIRDYTIIRGDLGDAHVKDLLAQTLDAPLDADAAT